MEKVEEGFEKIELKSFRFLTLKEENPKIIGTYEGEFDFKEFNYDDSDFEGMYYKMGTSEGIIALSSNYQIDKFFAAEEAPKDYIYCIEFKGITPLKNGKSMKNFELSRKLK